MARKRHVPMRTCIVCGRKADKRELVRVVANPEGVVSIDTAGKAPGRGAYVCRDDSSVPENLKRGKVEHALRTKINDGDWQEIQDSLLGVRVAEQSV